MMNKEELEAVLKNSIYEKFIDIEEDNGCLKRLSFNNVESFNFAFDVMDVLGRECPKQIAMLHVDKKGNETKLTFSDIMRLSNKTANYLKSEGIKKGDRVMLILKRHVWFWISILALHKIGAVAIPATSQLQQMDLEQRFKLGKISAIIATNEDDVPQKTELAEQAVGININKIMVFDEKEKWKRLDREILTYDDVFERTSDSACGEDKMIMFFTSGTTGYPKIVTHNHKYPFGHFVTAKYWHRIEPGNVHFTVSDTGWGKAMWGKLYGQWFCAAKVFVFEFDRFCAEKMLPMFKKYQIDTFCAPPTVYRMLIKEDLKNYDLSSIKCATTAGETLNPEVYSRFYEATGLNIMEGFGQTETTLTVGTLKGMTPKAGSMGKPVPTYNIKLINGDGKECKVNEVGEISVYDINADICGLFSGYYDREDLDNEVFYDGAYHTGDLAKKDEDGYFWYVGRKDDMIKSSGYKIAPCEVENVIMEIPYVLECAVSPEPDEIRGQVIKATVVLTSGTEKSESLKKEIQTYVKEKTAPYKYPRIVNFADELPKTISGKVIRSKL